MSGRSLAVGVVALLCAAGCTSGSSDNPAVVGPGSSASPTVTSTSGAAATALATARQHGVLLGVDGRWRLIRSWPGTDRADAPVALHGIPGGPSEIASDPGGGWVVTFTPQQHPAYGSATSRLAVVHADGTARPFGPTFTAAEAITSIAVRPDGQAVAVALFDTSGPGPARIRLLPMPGHDGRVRTWVASQRDANQIVSLSWDPTGKRLAYIAGLQTGAGMAGDPSFLDTSTSSRVAPASSPWRDKSCTVESASWLGDSGEFAAVRTCRDGQAALVRVDPATGAVHGSALPLPASSCVGPEIHPDRTGDSLLLSWCDHTYVATESALGLVDPHLAGAAWSGS